LAQKEVNINATMRQHAILRSLPRFGRWHLLFFIGNPLGSIDKETTPKGDGSDLTLSAEDY